MKLVIVSCAFIVLATAVFAQNNSSLISRTISATSENRWNFEQYIWSHTHPGPGKNGKPLLDGEAIEHWVSLPVGDGITISRDGLFFVYKMQNSYTSRVDSVIVQSTTNDWRVALGKEAWSGFFSADSRQFVFQNKQGLCFLNLGAGESRCEMEVGSYKIDGKKEWLAYMLQNKENTLVLLNLVSGKEVRFNEVATYNFNFNGLGQSSEWLVCQLKNNNLLLHSLVSQKDETFENIAAYNFDPSKRWFICQVNGPSKDVTLYDLYGGNKRRFFGVGSWQFSKTGDGLLLNGNMQLDYVSLKDGKNNSVWKSTDTSMMISSAEFDETGKQVVFVVGNGSEKNIWYWSRGMEKAEMKVSSQLPGLGRKVLIQDGAVITDNGHYIWFTWQPVMTVEPTVNAVAVDVWSYRDKTLRCVQRTDIQGEAKERSIFNAVVDINTGQVVFLEQEYEKLEVINGDYALISKNGRDVYGDRFWEKGFVDSTWLLNLHTGSRQFLSSKKTEVLQSYVWFSPNGRYVIYFDAVKQCNYFSLNLATGTVVKISAGVPAWQLGITFSNYRMHENPSRGSTIKIWINDGKEFLVYDNFNDIWQLDASGRKAAVCITNGLGRLKNISFGLLLPSATGQMKANMGEGTFIGEKTLLLSAYNRKTKLHGFYRKVLGDKGDPELLSMEPCYLAGLREGLNGKYPIKAEAANTWIVNHQTPSKAPNFYVTYDFKTYKQLTFLQPQKKYNWFTAELHTFKRLDGTISQGVLYKPENFDPAKKYPVIINFYGKESDRLYTYPNAEYIFSPNILENPAWMVSHGYLVFVPDMLFTQGQWGPSTVNTVEGAVRYLRQFSYVDSLHMGAAGHSNSARFGYYLLTHSRSFAAICVGAAHSNTISSALSRGVLEIYEVTGFGTGLGNLWENKNSWLDQSPVLSADKVVSPLLLFHNKKDGVPIEGAVQMFTALRRLDKKVWWLQYDNGRHSVRREDARDFTIRFTQFFDHYLKGAPPARWMSQVVPTSSKGIENRYELDFEGSCGPGCPICSAKSWMSKK